jgi:ribonuclease HIII
MKTKTVTSYTVVLSDSERKKLESIISDGIWEKGDAPYAFWKAKKPGISLVAFQSGKLTIQGKETFDFVTFTLEPEVTGKVKLGYTKDGKTEEPEEDFLPLPHAGMDESGKGDFFGPLVIAAVFVEDEMNEALIKCGVKDSKAIKGDKKIPPIANEIRKIVNGKFSVVQIGPQAYNRLYSKIGNLNKLLAWGHARVLENILEKSPECDSALADKFGNSSLIENALMEKGQKIKLHQRTKGESDIAVAAASILARDEFLRQMKKLSDEFNTLLPKGAGLNVDQKVRELVAEHGIGILEQVGKTHFKTVEKALASDSEN